MPASGSIVTTVGDRTLTLTNLDDTEEELAALAQDTQVFRVTLSGRGAHIRRPLSRVWPHTIVSTRHPWMRAWIYVSPHPYVALTDDKGFFHILNVPAGRYTVRAWHEGWKEKRRDAQDHIEYYPVEEIRTVKVPGDGTVEVFFEQLSATFL